MLWSRTFGDRAHRTVLFDASALRTMHRVRGIGRYVSELLLGLAETRSQWERQIRVLAVHDLYGEPAAAVSEDLAGACHRALDAPMLDRYELATRRRWALQRFAIALRAALVHETDNIGSPIAALVPRIVTSYDLIPLRFREHYLPRARDVVREWTRAWRRYFLARRVVAISQRTAMDLHAILRVPVGRVQVVPTGIDLRFWTDPGSCAGLSLEEVKRRIGVRGPFVLYVGGADYRKNIEGMFRAMSLLYPKTGIVLVYAGDLDEHFGRHVRSLAEQLHASEAVRFAGYVDDASLATLYRGAAAQLFLSRLEGFGLPVAEAMACGCPSVVARHSGCDEFVADAGIAVEADDPAAAAEAVTRLHVDAAFRATFAERCAARVARMTRAEMALGYIEAYRTALRIAPA